MIFFPLVFGSALASPALRFTGEVVRELRKPTLRLAGLILVIWASPCEASHTRCGLLADTCAVAHVAARSSSQLNVRNTALQTVLRLYATKRRSGLGKQ